MKKTILLSFVCLAVAMIAGYNVYQSNVKTKGLSDLALENVEALAGCESPVLHYWGKTATILCKNSNGDVYSLEGCDFDNGYKTLCEGRQVND